MNILECFIQAKLSNVKNPVLRYKRFKFAAVPHHSADCGCVYFYKHTTYIGKITRQCKIQIDKLTDNNDDIEHIVFAMQNPKKAALDYGNTIGKCSICNKELTSSLSVKMGIGLVCGQKYNLIEGQ